MLSRAGYDTAYIGKWHLGGVPRDRFIPPEERLGFDYWRACNCNHDYYHAWYDDNDGNRFCIDGYEPAAQTELALDYLRTRAEDGAPWAMVLSYGTPHDPYELVPQAYKQRYLERNLDFRGNIGLPAVLNQERHIQADELRDWYAGYYAHISALDDQFGRLTAYLEEHGLMENTVVLYTSDHGDMLGSQGLTNKQLPYEESAHIPMILRYDGHVQPGRRRQLMSLVDLAPTLAGLVGLSFRGEVDGLDLHDLFLRPDAPARRLFTLPT